jgi:hypothetical protein
VSAISGYLESPVADQTGLTGTYDLILRFIDEMRPQPNAEPAPSLASALEAGLGLKLEKGKGPVEVLVIDHLAKPSENWRMQAIRSKSHVISRKTQVPSGDIVRCAGINRHVVGNARVLQERRKRIHLGPKPCG